MRSLTKPRLRPTKTPKVGKMMAGNLAKGSTRGYSSAYFWGSQLGLPNPKGVGFGRTYFRLMTFFAFEAICLRPCRGLGGMGGL